MASITALRDTIGKKEPIDSSLLPDDELFKVNKDWTCEIKKIIEYTDNNHVHVDLEYDAGAWFFFLPHIHIDDDEKKETLSIQTFETTEFSLETAPFNTQLDNPVEPHRTCNSSSHYMQARSILPSLNPDDSQYVIDVMNGKHGNGNKNNPSIYWNTHVNGLASMGIKIVTKHGDFDAVLDQCEKGILTPVNIAHRGHISAPTNGHVVCIVGSKNNRSMLYVHDPYGELDYINGTSDLSKSGKYWVSKTNFLKRWQKNWSQFIELI